MTEIVGKFVIHMDGLVQDCSNSIANMLELLQSCIKPLISCVQNDIAISRPLFQYVCALSQHWFQVMVCNTETIYRMCVYDWNCEGAISNIFSIWNMTISLKTRGWIQSCMKKLHGWQVWWNIIFTLIAKFVGLTWGPTGANRTQVGPMVAPWTLLSEYLLT